MLRKHPLTVRRTKFIMNKGADLHISGALAFEVPVTPFSGTTGIRPRNQAARNHRIKGCLVSDPAKRIVETDSKALANAFSPKGIRVGAVRPADRAR
jgi:hypothetical protein